MKIAGSIDQSLEKNFFALILENNTLGWGEFSAGNFSCLDFTVTATQLTVFLVLGFFIQIKILSVKIMLRLEAEPIWSEIWRKIRQEIIET